MKKFLICILFGFSAGLHLLLAILMVINGDYLFALLPTLSAGFCFTYCTIKLKNGFAEDEEDANI